MTTLGAYEPKFSTRDLASAFLVGAVATTLTVAVLFLEFYILMSGMPE